MGMALAETHSSGDTEPDCSIPRKNSSGGIRTPTNKQNFKPKICPLYKKYNDKEGPRTERMANNNQPKLRHGKHQSLTLLMILCYACNQESSITVLWETRVNWNKCRDSQPHIGQNSWTLTGELGEHVRNPNWIGVPTGRPTKSTSWNLGGPQRLNYQPKSIYKLKLGQLHLCSMCILVFLQDPNNWSRCYS